MALFQTLIAEISTAAAVNKKHSYNTMTNHLSLCESNELFKIDSVLALLMLDTLLCLGHTYAPGWCTVILEKIERRR